VPFVRNVITGIRQPRRRANGPMDGASQKAEFLNERFDEHLQSFQKA